MSVANSISEFVIVEMIDNMISYDYLNVEELYFQNPLSHNSRLFKIRHYMANSRKNGSIRTNFNSVRSLCSPEGESTFTKFRHNIFKICDL